MTQGNAASGRNHFRRAVSAVTLSILRERCGCPGQGEDPRHERVVCFILAQHARMPDYLRLPIVWVTLLLDVWAIASAGRPLHRLPHQRRWLVIRAWSRSRLAFQRDLIKFFESLTIFGWFAQHHERWPG